MKEEARTVGVLEAERKLYKGEGSAGHLLLRGWSEH